MSYESAAATKLLATHCAICGRPLVDAMSVEAGIGPDCREKYGYDASVAPAARAEANVLIYQIAADRSGAGLAALPGILVRLESLGFALLAARVAHRIAKVTIKAGPGVLWVRTPYNAGAVEAFKRIPGRVWRAGEKKGEGVNIVPETRRADLWRLLRAYYAGVVGTGPKGLFLIA